MGTANHRHPVRPHGNDTSLRRGRLVSTGPWGSYSRDRTPDGLSEQHECRRTRLGHRAASSTIDPHSGKEGIL